MGVIEHFRIGQPVEVVPDYRYGEWQGVPLFIVAVRCVERSAFDVTYDVSERWPTQSHGDVTTDFTTDDLVARNAEPIHRRDGDAEGDGVNHNALEGQA